jgi:hypothetical protein
VGMKNDPVLRKKVEDFLGGDLPEVLKFVK